MKAQIVILKTKIRKQKETIAYLKRRLTMLRETTDETLIKNEKRIRDLEADAKWKKTLVANRDKKIKELTV